MANNTYDVVRPRRGTLAEWEAKNPILKLAEEAYITDLHMSKHGDGVHTFKELEYDKAEGGTYSSAVPVTQSIGGIKAGETFDNITYDDLWNKLLYPYVAPAISLSASPSGSTRVYSNNISSVSLTATVTEKSNNIQNVVFYLDGTAIGTVTEPSTTTEDSSTGYTTKTYKLTYSNEIASASTNYSASTRKITAKVYDGQSYVTSSAVQYVFVCPMYIGFVAGTVTTVTNDLIKTMSELIKGKSNQSKIYYMTDSKFAFAYPKIHGKLTSILETNGFEIIGDFEIQEVNVTQYDGTTTVPYYVYLFKNVTSQDGFTVTYKFS